MEKRSYLTEGECNKVRDTARALFGRMDMVNISINKGVVCIDVDDVAEIQKTYTKNMRYLVDCEIKFPIDKIESFANNVFWEQIFIGENRCSVILGRKIISNDDDIIVTERLDVFSDDEEQEQEMEGDK